TEVLDLDEISLKGEGVEVVSGLTGFGLPPVEVFWSEGAGDGAQPRGRRVLPRDIDLPLHIAAPGRQALKQMVNKISRVMTGKMILRVYDTNEDYHLWVEVYRTGGGTFTYGVDTDGEYTWEGIVTVRAGDPYFRRSQPVTETILQATSNNMEYEARTIEV